MPVRVARTLTVSLVATLGAASSSPACGGRAISPAMADAGSVDGSVGGSASGSGSGASGSGSSGAQDSSSGSNSSSGSSLGDGSSSSGDADVSAPSCATGGPGQTNCGAGGDETCCGSLPIPSGTFYRSYDGMTSGYTATTAPATVSAFRLDKYEITVGRFRQFVSAVIGGYLPAPGSGKHAHLNGGHGLADSGSPSGTYETGWDSAWNAGLATTSGAWTANLECAAGQTWTTAPTNGDNRPVNCATWYEAYAFCIWDGGFLPSEAEWNYAASGGSDQRAYPWSAPSSSVTIDCNYANYDTGTAYCVGAPSAVGSDSTKGDGKWGQTDLAGNVWEWALDWDAPYVAPCVDCATLSAGATMSGSRVIRGGGFAATARSELASFRGVNAPTARYSGYVGARCARAP